MKRILFLTLVFSFAIFGAQARKIPVSYPVLPDKYFNYSGQLESVIYPTSITGPVERRMYVYLPKEYSSSGLEYPVVYFLHGARGDEASWITQGDILPKIDSLIEYGLVKPTIVVFANMNSYKSDEDYAKSRHKGALESFFEVDGSVESSFVEDVVVAVDSIFRTIPEKRARAIAGLSLGGMQAMYISASHPDVFDYVGLFSSPVHSVIKKGPYSDFYDNLEDKINCQFSQQPKYYGIYVGTNDIYLKTMTKFFGRLNSLNYKCDFHKEKGGHKWPLWTYFATEFMKNLWTY